jgi:hypothetical protein
VVSSLSSSVRPTQGKGKGKRDKEGWFKKEMIPIESSDWKAGKKSQVFPRSGNKSCSFTKQ